MSAIERAAQLASALSFQQAYGSILPAASHLQQRMKLLNISYASPRISPAKERGQEASARGRRQAQQTGVYTMFLPSSTIQVSMPALARHVTSPDKSISPAAVACHASQRQASGALSCAMFSQEKAGRLLGYQEDTARERWRKHARDSEPLGAIMPHSRQV